MPFGTVLGIIAAVLALAVLLPFVQGARRKATLDLLRSELDVERDARVEQERRCAVEIGELRGQLQVVNERFAGIIAREVVKVMRDEGVIPR